MAATTAAQRYAEVFDAAEKQRRRLGMGQPAGDRWSAAAARFSADPRREPDANLLAIAGYLRPEHVLLDVGGGAGRYSLPLALRCREAINVEPARGMGEAFQQSAAAAGIGNARWVESDWEHAEGVTGDVSLVANVTYFVRDIVPFVEKLVACSRERVILASSVTPPPNQGAALFSLVHGEEQAPVPGHHELLPVLWEMGIEPEVRVLERAEATSLGGVSPTREEAIESALATRSAAGDAAAARHRIEEHFEELFVAVPEGYRRRASGDPRFLLVTWDTRPPRGRV